jgi:hypothetical protein
MATDLTPTTGTATPDGGTPFVRVVADKTHGRAVIALDADAIDALLQFVDDLGPGYDLTQNPGTYGIDDATAHRLADVMGRITGPLSRLKGYL